MAIPPAICCNSVGHEAHLRSRYNIAYIRFQERREEVESLRISDEPVVDVAPAGTELRNANEQLQREDMGELVVVNEATGEHANPPQVKTKAG